MDNKDTMFEEIDAAIYKGMFCFVFGHKPIETEDGTRCDLCGCRIIYWNMNDV